MNYAICNETFAGWSHDRVCGFIAELGYTGLEVAPFTLAKHITDVSANQRADFRRIAEREKLSIIGLHWLLAETTGFHLTSPDPGVRMATGQYLAELARATADLGGTILVLGSPAQRKLPAGVDRVAADEYALQTLMHCLPTLETTQVVLALEPLGPEETNYLNTAAEAMGLIRRIGHPNVRLHLDVKAMSTEAAPPADVIRAHATYLAHFHANDPNRRGPGTGDQDFKPILATLTDVGYTGFVSVEVFDYTPDPETIARDSIAYLRSCEPAA